VVKNRQNLISKEHREEIQKYITGIVQQNRHKMIAIYCMPDHTHLLIGARPDVALSDIVRDIKAGSSFFINSKKLSRMQFRWQVGFGAFTYSRSEVPRVAQYIADQERHHSKAKFKDEYLALLNDFEVEYDDKYLFEWIE
jgi:REP element-mobilizing transposase RayT